ncbi:MULTISPECIES: choice-of-anchor I family protein [unclassified Niallia]|uniref:choice-of-anchor I family protein n=1 Tax=unclassified Niallia TaxID=2837522 RepID=UPI001EDA5944|nr:MULTISPECIES: choice-of-anchor I family protein [unclassified Niallia]MDL0437563.1 choice-of-anchor I family protein [Niallia sp. SS-2023]UPO88210.1 choice-of-anchor I family protein [Niallia sp. Man26]
MKLSKKLKGISTLSLTGLMLFSAYPSITLADSSLDVKKIASYSTGITDEDGGVAEIVQYNKDNEKFYVINGKAQTIDVVNMSGLYSTEVQNLQKEKSINIADVVNSDSFQYGDLTSIDINTDKKIIAAAVQDADYTKNGRIVVMNYDGEVQETFEAGVQPDMVKISDDGNFILTADEAEPRQGLENGVDPEGSVTIVNYDTKEVQQVKFNDTSVIDQDVHIRNNGTTADAVHDLEPEYLALNKDASKAYVTLQENNAVASIDVKTGKVLSVKSLGYKDHSVEGNGLDAARNDKIEIKQLPILGAYMPDSIAQTEIGGVEYLLTANEGDATEWEEFVNIEDFKKVKDSITLDTSLFKGFTKEEAEAAFQDMKDSGDYDKLEVLTDRGTDAIYTLGGRSFSIWKADTMELVYDSGSDFEDITAAQYPDVFNWSNDDNVFEKRSAKKGPEPEDVKVGQIGNDLYAFIGLERIGGYMTYNISNPSSPSFANYLNTRDFSSAVSGDVAPEGLEFIEAADSPTGRPLVLVGNEVSGTVSVNEYQTEQVIPIEEIALTETEATLEVSKTLALTASVKPANTTESKELTWTSSDANIATVNETGLVTAVAPGTATITVETADKKHQATSVITVTAPVVADDENDADQDTDTDTETGSKIPDEETSSQNDQDNSSTENSSDNNSNESDNTEVVETVAGNDDNNDGNALPDTATSNYSFLLYGGIILAGGGILYFIAKRKLA